MCVLLLARAVGTTFPSMQPEESGAFPSGLGPHKEFHGLLGSLLISDTTHLFRPSPCPREREGVTWRRPARCYLFPSHWPRLAVIRERREVCFLIGGSCLAPTRKGAWRGDPECAAINAKATSVVWELRVASVLVGSRTRRKKKVRGVQRGGRHKTLAPRSLFGFNLGVAGARPPAGLAGLRRKHRCLWLAPAESPTLARPRRCPWRPRL